MFLALIIIAFVVICFGGVLVVGAPYLPTLKQPLNSAMILADLKPGQVLLELGCGDGRVLVAAARQGVVAIGYELNPLLVLIAWFRTRPYKSLVSVKWANYWSVDWPKADIIYVFLLPRYMTKLDKLVEAYSYRPVKLISYAFRIKGRKAISKTDGFYIYSYK